MPRSVDVLVIGGGPGGSIAARRCAEAGLRVLMIEKRQEIG
ncbi:MAG: FAD-dependent oxidoreductase, partial [Thermoflexales bacterium]|nr:FAD-dependent oxidoreductase [Thermoflexales bacterium]MBP8242347.1 FAD-dependent oxidoreductase [Thermoflexales bacterium]